MLDIGFCSFAIVCRPLAFQQYVIYFAKKIKNSFPIIESCVNTDSDIRKGTSTEIILRDTNGNSGTISGKTITVYDTVGLSKNAKKH